MPHDWSKDPRMPINLADKIAKAKIPVLLLYGGADTVVPPSKNCEIFIPRFKAAGGNIKVFKRDMYGHHPHGFQGAENVGAIVDFFEGKPVSVK
jgi:dienelactone hydrolase